MATAAQFVPAQALGYNYPLSNVLDPYRPLTEIETRRILLPTDHWTNQYAATITNAWKDTCDQYLVQSGNMNRWMEADRQYVAWRPQQVWGGNPRKPKARIPVFLLFSQLQAMLPNVLSAMFPLHENVEIAPRPGSTLEQAKAAWELIMAQLDSLGEQGLMRFRDVALEAFSQAFLYGNGIVEVSWLYKVLEKAIFAVDWESPRAWQRDPLSGQLIMAPSGPPKRILREMRQQYILNQPNIQCIDIRDFLIDPQLRTQRINEARYCGVRHYPSVGELTTYRNQPGFDIPDDQTLIKLSEQRPTSQGEQYKQMAYSWWGNNWQAANDYSTNPYDKRVELVRWYTDDRCIWNINGLWIAYNAPNIYQFKPFLNAFYVPFPNRFHGLSLADVTEGDQNMIASLLEARINELSLSLSAPFVRRTGTMVGNPGSLAMSPEKIIDVSDEPDKAIKRLDVQAMTQTAMVETNDIYARTARTTGLNDATVMGVPQAGGNSAQRTATGMDKLAAASGIRIQFLVENGQSSLIEPLCTILHMFNVKFLPRDAMISILNSKGQQQVIDPVLVLNANPRFTVRAAQRMAQRGQLMQILPWFVQTLLNPELMQLMAKFGKKLNVPNLMLLVTDTLNTPQVDLWADLTPQDQQAMNQPDPETMMQLQMQRERLQNMSDNAASAEDAQLIQTILKLLGTPQNIHSLTGQHDPQMMTARANMVKAHHPLILPPATGGE